MTNVRAIIMTNQEIENLKTGDIIVLYKPETRVEFVTHADTDHITISHTKVDRWYKRGPILRKFLREASVVSMQPLSKLIWKSD